MLRNRALPLVLMICSIVLHCGVGHAQTSSTSVTEDFTGTTTNNQWYFYGDACLTAGTTSVTGNLGLSAGTDASGNPIFTFEGCVANTNYTENLVGGYNGSKSGSVAIGSRTALDPGGYGALRFTNGCINSSTTSCSSGSGGGHNQNGAIISANTFSTSQGLDITFKTVTYRGDSQGGGSDGADGMSFFLMDGGTDLTVDPTENIGSYGGSLGYTCSNKNNNETEPYHGMVGAYLGLGIDEYGNFLNGSSNNLGETDGSWNDAAHWEDNTASGGLYKPNRIGLRGRGNIAWNWLTTKYPADYPAGLSASAQNQAVQYTCQTGYLWDFSAALTGGSATETTTQVDDYLAIPDAYKIFSKKIANEYSSGGYSRRPPGSTTATGDTGATPITYRLKITQDGILSLAYSYDGGAWSNVIQNRQISASNDGGVPGTVRFGFAGSTGGSSNIHEILCFKATPVTQAASSTTVNQQQSSKVESGSQAYFGYYDPTDWTGRLTANSLLTDSSGNLTIASAANWDASCVLTGVTTCPTTGASGPTSPQSYKNSDTGGRVILTWSGSAGIPLQYASLSSSEQSAITAGDSSPASYRVDYLRGDRENEIPTTGASGNKIYRDRDSVLGDIVDSSSAWVGPPSKSAFSAYESPFTWRDKLYPTATMSENTHSYDSFAQGKARRLNVVYVGSNDGMVHGFSAGAYDSSGTTYDSSTNTGKEVLAYMPQGVLQTIHNSSDSTLDFSNTQYGHNFFVDATPGTGDLYYGSAWHTWLVGGLGPGGAEIYALDITDPSTFSEGTTSAAATVIGDWLPSSITCTNPTDGTTNSCKDASGNSYLGNTYGTPQIRRLHNGDWAVLFGNGIGSPSGDAGLFILTVDPSGIQTLYYLSTGVSGSNGIAYVTPVDMDGDHVVDYVYAGDLLGNVWRFDLTGNSAASWAVTPGPIFKAPSGQPITTAIQPDFVTGPIGSTTQLMLFFGSGEKFPLTNSSPVSYQTGTQNFYGVWDWNMTAWNAHNSSQFAKVAATTVGTLTSLGSPYTLGTANLRSQTISIDGSTGDRLVQSTNPVCWAGTSTCSGGSGANAKFGWYISLPGTNTAFSATTYEQVTFNAAIVSTAVVFNSILPAVDSPLMCTPDKDKGWTYALDVRSGGAIPNFFVNPGTTTTKTNNLATQTIGYEADASGTSSEVDTNNGSGGTNYYLIFQSNSGGAAPPLPIQPGANISSSRQTWIQLR